MSVWPYFHEPQVSEIYSKRVQYPAILPSHTSDNRFIINYSYLAVPRR